MCRCSEATAWPVHKGTAILVTHCEQRNTSISELKRPAYLTSELSWKILINYRLPLALRQVIFPCVFFSFFLLFSFPDTQKVLWPLLQKNWQTTKRFYSSFIVQNKRTPNLYLMCFMQSLEECAMLTVIFNLVSCHNRIPKSLLIYIYVIYKYVPGRCLHTHVN